MADDLNIDWSEAARADNGQIIPVGRDSEYNAHFYMGKVPNFDMTDYVEVPHLRLQAPGNTRTIYDQPARMESYPTRPSDPERFPVQWAAFKRGENVTGNGTPLEEWEGISAGDVRRLDINGVRTVEQLAMVSDGHLDGLGFGGRLIREKARAFVSGRSQADPEKQAMKSEISDLREMLELLLAEKEQAAPKRPRATAAQDA